MSALLSPSPRLRFFGDDGKPLAGGHLFTYDSVTSRPLATYSDAGMESLNPTEILLDANGEPSYNGHAVEVYLESGKSYKFVWYDRDGEEKGSADPIQVPDESNSGAVPNVSIISPKGTLEITTIESRGWKTFELDVKHSAASWYKSGPCDQLVVDDTEEQVLPISEGSGFGDDIALRDSKFYLKKGIYHYYANVNLATNSLVNEYQTVKLLASSNRSITVMDFSLSEGKTVMISGLAVATHDNFELCFKIETDSESRLNAYVVECGVFKINGATNAGGGEVRDYTEGDAVSIDRDVISVNYGVGLDVDLATNKLVVSRELLESIAGKQDELTEMTEQEVEALIDAIGV